MIPPRKSCGPFAALLCWMVISGCASQASFTTFEPGNGPGLGSQRIAVLGVTGPPQLAGVAETELKNRLRSVGLYKIVPPPKTPTVTTASFQGRDGDIVRWSQSKGVDTLLRASIKGGYQGGGAAGISIGDPKVRVALTVELVDAQLNQVLARETFVETDRVDSEASASDQGSEENVFAALAAKCAQQATELFIHEKTIQAELASAGYGIGGAAADIRRGNKLANTGNWSGAKQAYQAALQADPKNADAAYNLGVAHEALHQYGTARNLYRMAADQSNNSEYRSAEARIERAVNAQRVAAKIRRQHSQHAQVARSRSRPVNSKWIVPATANLPSRPVASGAARPLTSGPNVSRPIRLPPVH